VSVPVLRLLPLGLLALAAHACAPAGQASGGPQRPPAASAPADTGRVYPIGEVGTPPEFANLRDVIRWMTRNHPPLLRDAGRGGTVVLMVQVGRDGRVRGSRLLRSSGDAQMDAAATRAAAILRGRPAHVEDTPVAVEVEIPFEFGIGP
jgi:TonB family protein